MSRAIKFRAWVYDQSGKQFNMCYSDEDLKNFFSWFYPPRSEGKDILMQYTGLKDYTVLEQEIYEGDILLCNEQGEYLEVFYNNGAFRIQFSFEDESTVLTDKIIKANWLKKVGNIYENPELIED